MYRSKRWSALLLACLFVLAPLNFLPFAIAYAAETGASKSDKGTSPDFFTDPEKGYFNQQLTNYGKKDGLSSVGTIRIPRPHQIRQNSKDKSEKENQIPPVAPSFVRKQAPISAPQAVPKSPDASPPQKPTAATDPGALARPGLLPGIAPGKPQDLKTTTAKPVETLPVQKPSPSTEVVDAYPAVGQLEELTFGQVNAGYTIEERLTGLETAIFARTFQADSLFDRTERLKKTLLGQDALDSGGAAYDTMPPGWIEGPTADLQADSEELAYLDEIASDPENQEAQPLSILGEFALELINLERRKRNMPALENEELLQKMADAHLQDLVGRGVISHSNSKGHNPDRRYSLLGGTNAISESLVSLNTADLRSSKLTKAAVASVIKKMMKRQDDREALLAPESTHVALALGEAGGGTRIFACAEIMTKRGKLNAIPRSSKLGAKIDVEGVVFEPYKFERITLAFEENQDTSVPEDPAGDEALPYFPPLDYTAYKEKSEKDFSKAITALKAVGLIAAIAGGMFVPPVALAAPLIIMAGPDPTEMKPASDIPVHGGVKVNGNTFSGHIPLSNDHQKGLYYVTVWGTLGDGARPVVISRRIVLASDEDEKDNDEERQKPGSIEYTKDNQQEGDKDRSANSDDDRGDDENDNRKNMPEHTDTGI
ncbi:MAG: hypothetical protein K8F91_24270 [Candidatus Obscuribacterales bacterium]|nr:hypothetical protein [Candidatus Obscuribacterales bacterium]